MTRKKQNKILNDKIEANNNQLILVETCLNTNI